MLLRVTTRCNPVALNSGSVSSHLKAKSNPVANILGSAGEQSRLLGKKEPVNAFSATRISTRFTSIKPSGSTSPNIALCHLLPWATAKGVAAKAVFMEKTGPIWTKRKRRRSDYCYLCMQEQHKIIAHRSSLIQLSYTLDRNSVNLCATNLPCGLRLWHVQHKKERIYRMRRGCATRTTSKVLLGGVRFTSAHLPRRNLFGTAEGAQPQQEAVERRHVRLQFKQSANTRSKHLPDMKFGAWLIVPCEANFCNARPTVRSTPAVVGRGQDLSWLTAENNPSRDQQCCKKRSHMMMREAISYKKPE